jgi:predicted Zn-dependent peptidase
MRVIQHNFRPALAALLGAILYLSATIAPGQSAEPESWRKSPPRSGPARPLRLPAAREVKLENGLALVLIEDRRAPIVTLSVGLPLESLPFGSENYISRQIALADATAALLTEGAAGRTGEQIARDVETLGGRIWSTANEQYAEVGASFIAESAGQMIETFADVLVRPTFPQSEVALYKKNRIQELRVERQDPAFLVSEHFNRIIYGPHPYGITAPSTAAITAIGRPALLAFHKAHYTPDRAVAVVVGDFESARMESQLSAALGRWKKTLDPRARPVNKAPAARRDRRIYLIDRPDSEQATFRIGGLAVERSHPDFYPLLVANAVLGAGTGSRLFLNVREKKGYAYDVFSTMSALKVAGTFFAGADTRNEVTAAAVKEILGELDRLSRQPVGPDEIENAKSFLTGNFSLSLSTQTSLAERIVASRMLGLGGDYLESHRSRVEAVTAEQVLAAARKYASGEHAAIVVVGDAARLKPELSKIAPVIVIGARAARRRAA